MSAILRTLAGMLVWFLLSTICGVLVLSVMMLNDIITYGQGDWLILNGIIVGTVIGAYRGYKTPF